MHTLTITFPDQELSNRDLLSLVMEFERSTSEDDIAVDAENVGLKVTSWGNFKINYDLEDALLVPGNYSLEIGDAEGYLDDLFFGDTINGLITNKQAKITLSLNTSIVFIGFIIEDSITQSEGKLKVKFTAAPRTDVLTKQRLWDLDGNPLNPVGYTPGFDFMKVPLVDIVSDIYEKVDTDIDFELFHDWIFSAKSYADPFPETEVTFSGGEIIVSLFNVYIVNNANVNTLADVLKLFAMLFCSYTGMIHQKRAFFKKLFTFNSANTQELGTVFQYEKDYKFSTIDYVRATEHHYTTAVDFFSYPYDAGVFTELEGRYIDKILPVSFAEGLNDFSFEDSGFIYSVEKAKDPSLGDKFLPHGKLFAYFWHNFRSKIEKCKVAKFVVSGYNYDFLKDFQYNGNNFQIIDLDIDYSKEITTIIALNLGPTTSIWGNQLLTNGTFDNADDWTFSNESMYVENGLLVFDAVLLSGARTSVSITAGKYYKINIMFSNITEPVTGFSIASLASGVMKEVLVSPGTIDNIMLNGNGDYEFYCFTEHDADEISLGSLTAFNIEQITIMEQL